MSKVTSKRHGQTLQRNVKRRKTSTRDARAGKSQNGKGKRKEKGNKEIIEIPNLEEDGDYELSEQDDLLLEDYGGAAFLQKLDVKGISRSKNEIQRLHKLNKPQRTAAVDDDLPSVDSHDSDNESWTSNLSDDNPSLASDVQSAGSDVSSNSLSDDENSDVEMPYEQVPRRPTHWKEPEETIQKLPIKLANGKIQRGEVALKISRITDDSESSSSEDVDDEVPAEDGATAARFGRAAVVDVVSNSSKKARIQGAKDQIAGICQDIIADPENSIVLLRRLHTFCLPEISTASHPEPVKNDPIIRKMTFLSQLAVFLDIVPGYRIRELSDKERAEKVSQVVQRTRDFEQGLVSSYQAYLRVLEAELKAKSELSDVALRCVCKLLTKATHFNFRVNLIAVVIAQLSRKSWDDRSQLCLTTITTIFRTDITGEPSLEVVRLLNRMIKERHFKVHTKVISCLWHLRLKTDLHGIRASEAKAEKEEDGSMKAPTVTSRKKSKAAEKPYLSKKARKRFKENKEIEDEMHEAEAEVDKDERAHRLTETLKLLFSLYFRILKLPHRTALLPAALHGISRFAHLVNIDFFKDLMQVLKDLVTLKDDDATSGDLDEYRLKQLAFTELQHKLQCIVTAFELLTGQGEALDIDLSDFVNLLYAVIPSVCLSPELETDSTLERSQTADKSRTLADLLFRALDLVFSTRSRATAPPPTRTASFAKRLLTSSLHLPASVAVRAVEFVKKLVAKEPKLHTLLSTDDRTCNGQYRPDIDDPQLSNPFATSFWELHLLEYTHVSADVRRAAHGLLRAPIE